MINTNLINITSCERHSRLLEYPGLKFEEFGHGESSTTINMLENEGVGFSERSGGNLKHRLPASAPRSRSSRQHSSCLIVGASDK